MSVSFARRAGPALSARLGLRAVYGADNLSHPENVEDAYYPTGLVYSEGQQAVAPTEYRPAIGRIIVGRYDRRIPRLPDQNRDTLY